MITSGSLNHKIDAADPILGNVRSGSLVLSAVPPSTSLCHLDYPPFPNHSVLTAYECLVLTALKIATCF